VLRRTLNLGILAHVDAGKTTLTERLLYTAGVIDALGSVDAGTTQTDSLALERQRGITIKSAVVSFAIDDVTVNLIDTPGHPDFIAEVERVLRVLDGAVLVLSAVEGVQPQTRVLMRALQRLGTPTLLFVNKIDRAGAGYEPVLEAIAERLTPAIVAMGTVEGLGTRAARVASAGAGDTAFRRRLGELLAEEDESILAAFVDDDALPYDRLRQALAAQTGRARLHPVFFGSATTGAGIDSLRTALAELLPATEGDVAAPIAGTVFKIERDPTGHRIAYVSVSAGTLRVRDRIHVGLEAEERVTGIRVFDAGTDAPRTEVSAGEIAKVWGLGGIEIGDAVGRPTVVQDRQFAPPTLEAVVAPCERKDAPALRLALSQLAEQDPLIDVRQDDADELHVSLYGEVQKEVVQATLASDYGLDVTFRETTTICIERPFGTGEAVERLHAESNPFLATIALRVEPARDTSAVDFRLEVDPRTIPLYLYKTVESFTEHIGRYVRETLREGIFGWQVTGCAVTMVECTYSVPDGPPSRRGPLSTPADFRKLTPIVTMRALEEAGTAVCEPTVRAALEVPADAMGTVMSAVGRLGGGVETSSQRGPLATIESTLPAARVNELQRQLPGLTGGEGVLESRFAGYRPVVGEPPIRRRTTPDPRNSAEYLMHLARRVRGAG
jgi:ribosomal protection tetracycline resistance protein